MNCLTREIGEELVFGLVETSLGMNSKKFYSVFFLSQSSKLLLCFFVDVLDP